VQVEAPFVFRADDPPPPEPAPAREAALLPLADLPHPALLQTAVLPPPGKPRHGVFGRIKNFFAAIFG